MCCVMPPASPDCTLERRMRSRRLVFPWSTWPITVTTGGFSTRSVGSSGATSRGSGSSTAPISTSTPSSSATSSISSVERVWVSVFISPRPMRTLMIWVGETPRASPKSLTVAPGSTRTTVLSGFFSSTGARSGSLGAADAAAGRAAPRFLALASITTLRRFFCGLLCCGSESGSETGSSAGASAMVAPCPECSASTRASCASASWASVRPLGVTVPKTCS